MCNVCNACNICDICNSCNACNVCRKPVLFKGVFKSKGEPDGLIHLKSRNLVMGYMQVPGVDFTDSFSAFSSEKSNKGPDVTYLIP